MELLRRSYRKGRTIAAAAVRTRSGRLFRGVNIEGLYTPCAEPVAIGAAFAATERELSAMVAVGRRGRRFALLAPCGTCRQRLLDHAPEAYAIVPDRRGRPVRLAARASLPYAFTTFGR